MKTKSRPLAKSKEPAAPSPATETVDPESATDEKVPQGKLSLLLKPDGSFDWDTMRESTKQKLQSAIAGTSALRQTSAVPAAKVELFPPALIASLYSTLGAVESMVAQKVGNIPKHIADQVWIYSPQELELLGPPTNRVLSKYASDWMIRYQDEIALASLLLTLTLAKVNTSNLMAKMEKEKVVPAATVGANATGANVLEMPVKPNGAENKPS